MRNVKNLLLAAGLGLALAGLAVAASTGSQTVGMQVGSICVLAVTGNPSTLTVAAPATGGAAPTNPSSNATYAQYTSTVAASQSRRLTAAWGSSDAAPSGCSLKLTAAPSGHTNEGASAGQITLSSTAQDIVSTIKSCATGQGPTSGTQLTYQLSVDSLTALVASESKTATVTLTLTDAA